MKTLDLNSWNRKQHFEHFSALADPYFAVTVKMNVTKAYNSAKEKKVSFFTKYLHDCMKAINMVENLKYRIVDDAVVVYDVIHASPTLMRKDHTFAFSFVHYNNDIMVFSDHLKSEKNRVENSLNLYPPYNGIDCIYCSVLPWLNFSGHKEPYSGSVETV